MAAEARASTEAHRAGHGVTGDGRRAGAALFRAHRRSGEQRLARIAKDVQKWAKVEILAPQTGVIVEKNTNVNDMVDPSKDTPLFRIADLDRVLINANFNEEYLPLLQPLANVAHETRIISDDQDGTAAMR